MVLGVLSVLRHLKAIRATSTVVTQINGQIANTERLPSVHIMALLTLPPLLSLLSILSLLTVEMKGERPNRA